MTISSHARNRRATGLAVASVLTLASLISGCARDDGPSKAVAIANPASVYCKQQGGKLEIRHEKGGEVGYCHLAYGRVVEEWVLYRATQHQSSGH